MFQPAPALRAALRATFQLAILALSIIPTMGRAAVTDDMPVDARTRAAVLDSTIRFLGEGYYDSLAGARLAEAVGRARTERRFEGCATASSLCDSLTALLRRTVPDQHLKVVYSVRPRPMDAGTREPSAEERARQAQESRRRNYGFERVERLAGNVGYVDLRKFERPDLSAETATAAMTLVAGCDAVILDLRQNGGGDGDMVNYLMSYFLSGEPEHLRDIHDRPSRSMRQQWSLPYVPGPRLTDTPLYLLVGPRTFSAAEAFAFGLKERGRAVVVGTRSRGGAHPVRIRQVNEHFAVFVPHARVVDMSAGRDWEGTGVAPNIEAPAERALEVAHLSALRSVRERRGTPDDELDHAIAEAEGAAPTEGAPAR